VAKTQMAQREGFALQQAIQGDQIQRRTEEQIRAVNETQNLGEDGAEKIKDRGPQAQDKGSEKKKDEKQPPAEEEENRNSVFNDPYLGRNIDISL